MGDGTRFHILLFDGKMNFSVWKSSLMTCWFNKA